MSQLHNTTARPVAIVRAPNRSAILLAMAITVALLLAVAFGLGVAGRIPGNTAGIGDSKVTDGWMFGTSAIGAQRAASADVTDGWAGRYLVTAPGKVTDGWAGRLLVSAGNGQVTDGWAGRYLR